MKKAKNTTGQPGTMPNKQPASKLKGMLPKPAKTASIENMSIAISEGAVTSMRKKGN